MNQGLLSSPILLVKKPRHREIEKLPKYTQLVRSPRTFDSAWAQLSLCKVKTEFHLLLLKGSFKKGIYNLT
jgi:hypothetical protein